MDQQKEQAQLAALNQLDQAATGREAGSRINMEYEKSAPSLYDWHDIDRKTLPYEGIFYPSHWRIQARAAMAAEIKSWSTIDPNSPISVTDGITDMLKSCVRILDGNKKLSYKNILEHDKFYFILLVRHYTFPQPEKKLSYTVTHTCNHVNTVNLDFDTLGFKKISERAMDKYDYEACKFVASTKSFGLIEFKVPNVYKSDALRNYTLELARKQQTIDSTFTQIYWLIMTDDQSYHEGAKGMEECYDIYLGMDSEKVGLYLQIAEEFKPETLQEIKYTCANEKCGQEVHTPIQFPNGLRNLFFSANLDSELF